MRSEQRSGAYLRRIGYLLAWGAMLFPARVGAQGLLVNMNPEQSVRLPRPIVPDPSRRRPPPPTSYKIKALDVAVDLDDQVAKVQVSQSFVNTGSRQMEVSFVFPLPYDGAIDRLTLLVDGKEYPAKLLASDEARRIYESIVRQNKDPALLEWFGTGMFKTSVFPVPPGEERRVTLRYTQLCRSNRGLTDFLFPLGTAKYTSHPVESVSFRIAIESREEIKNVYSPSHTIDVQRPDNRRATVAYRNENQVPSSDFRLFYDVGRGRVGASVISYRPDDGEDGYFLLLTSPTIQADTAELTRKTILLVVDRSGSMSGQKLEQAKGALRFVLGNLREGDLFNLVAYDSEIESFRPELQKYDDASRRAALGFVEGLYASGSTNIAGALKTALGQLRDSSQPNYVIFLTDGLPTAGEKSEAKIVEGARSANLVRARVFTFGVGYDVNSRLLDKLARANYGQSEYVRPNEDIEASVSTLYRRISTPVMTDLAITFDVEGWNLEEGSPTNRIYPRETHDLFAGEQLVLIGRYRRPGMAKVTIKGMVGDQSSSFDFPAQLDEKSSDQSHAFVERLWAMRRVGEIIDELDLKGKNTELVKELVQLATKHGILTPYTSFLADESRDFRITVDSYEAAGERLKSLAQTSGRSAFAQRAAKGRYRNQVVLEGQAIGGGFAEYYDAADGSRVEVSTVKSVGRKTFFRRRGRWVDSSVTPQQEQTPIKVERYSKEYFELLDTHGREIAKYMAMDEPVVIDLDGQAYTW